MKPDFSKYSNGLVPAIIQDETSNRVLMLGYMNEEAYDMTCKEKKMVFFSRSRQQLWMKGETSGNYLLVNAIFNDCDNDCLLIRARPTGPVCHTGVATCFNEQDNNKGFLFQLEQIISNRREQPDKGSYTKSLFQKGINAIAQKVGEEAVELIIEAKDNNTERFQNEAADLLFHYLLLLQAKGSNLQDIIAVLENRHKDQQLKTGQNS